MLKENKGITLIALIITIIVMMILVAVSVTVALDGGLFDTAKKAGSETQLKADEEMLFSAVVGAIDENANVDFDKLKENLPDGFTGENGVYESSNGNRFTVSENGEINQVTFIYKDKIEGLGTGVTLVPYGELTGGLKTSADLGKISAVLKETKDGVGMQAVIPAGFEVSTEDGEDTISGGLVIFDVNGNEFVWVPCTADASDTSGLIKYAQDTRYNDGTIETKQYFYKDYSDWTDEGGNSQSVIKYGGFYVGRYEAGIPSNAPFYASTAGDAYIREARNTTAYIPVSKANQPSWNNISQVNAKIVSEKMYTRSISVKSGLIDSYAWDTIVNWMESEKSGIATDSTGYGNHIIGNLSLENVLYAQYDYDWTKGVITVLPEIYQKGTFQRDGDLYEIATGSTNDTKVLNIYDMTGNMWEWTTEIGYHNEGNSATQYAVLRGGGFHDFPAAGPISNRNGSVATSSGTSLGFRVVLYVK